MHTPKRNQLVVANVCGSPFVLVQTDCVYTTLLCTLHYRWCVTYHVTYRVLYHISDDGCRTAPGFRTRAALATHSRMTGSPAPGRTSCRCVSDGTDHPSGILLYHTTRLCACGKCTPVLSFASPESMSSPEQSIACGVLFVVRGGPMSCSHKAWTIWNDFARDSGFLSPTLLAIYTNTEQTIASRDRLACFD